MVLFKQLVEVLLRTDCSHVNSIPRRFHYFDGKETFFFFITDILLFFCIFVSSKVRPVASRLNVVEPRGNIKTSRKRILMKTTPHCYGSYFYFTVTRASKGNFEIRPDLPFTLQLYIPKRSKRTKDPVSSGRMETRLNAWSAWRKRVLTFRSFFFPSVYPSSLFPTEPWTIFPQFRFSFLQRTVSKIS